MSILNHQSISNLLFRPRPIPISNPFSVECEKATLACSFTQEASNRYTIVFFHGNGETVGEYAGLLPEVFSAIGCNTFLVEYRGYGMSSGHPGLGHLATDAEAVISAIPVDLGSLIIFGRSLGCIPAICAAAKFPRIHGLVLESPICDLFEYVTTRYYHSFAMNLIYQENCSRFAPVDWGLFGQQCLAQFNFQKMLKQFRGRSLVTHAEQDANIPLTSAETIFSWLPEPKVMKVFQDCDHNSIFVRNIEDYCEAILNMIRLEL